MTQKVVLMLSRVTMRKSGLAEYLEKGKRADSKHSRLEKDHVTPLYGSLDVLRKAEEHCLSTKKWNYNYEHITISFSTRDEEILSAMDTEQQNIVLQDIAKMMIRHRTYGYDLDNEVIAYAEVHAPKIQEETNVRTGEIQSRKKHIHIGISYLNPLSDTKLRTTFFNSSYISDTIDRYIAKKHGLHDATPMLNTTDEKLEKKSQREETHIALERKAIKKLLAPVKNQEELLEILHEKHIAYNVAKGKQGTYIKLINPHGKNINLRGKDFKHLEIFGSTVLSPLEKEQHLKELKNKSLYELEAILETYYKEHRLPMIEKRRSKKDTQKLKAIHEEEQALQKDKAEENSFSSFQEKLFYQHYHHKVQKSLQGYSVNTKDKKAVIFIHKDKEIHIEDKGDTITANASTKNLSEKVALMIEIAEAKGWDLSTLEIKGSPAFKEEAIRQIAQILRTKEQTMLTKRKTSSPTLPRPKTPLQYNLKHSQEKHATKHLPLAEIKQMLAAQKVLAYAVKHYKLDASRYEITADNKINNLHNKQKPKNVIDFLQKELNFSSKEAIDTCKSLYDAQPIRLEIDKESHALPTPISIDIQSNEQWESKTIKDYNALAHTLKSHCYSQKNHTVPGTLHPLLIYTIRADAHTKGLSMGAAKTLLEQKNTPALMLPLEENTHPNNKASQSYRIFIPVQTHTVMTEKNQALVHKEIAKQLGLYPYLVTNAQKQSKDAGYASYSPHSLQATPQFTQVPQDTKVLNIDAVIKKANKTIEQIERSKVTLARAKKALEQSTKPPTFLQDLSDKTSLTCIDTQAILSLDVKMLVETFEEIQTDKPIEALTFIQTKSHSYLHDSKNPNHLYDIKEDRILHALDYLKEVLQSEDVEIIAEALETKLDKSFSIPNHEAIQEQLELALKESTSTQALCSSMQRHFNVEISLREDILTLGSMNIALKSLGSSKEAAKENEELTQDKHIAQPRGRGRGMG